LGDRITYVGLDVHKDGIVVAVAEGGLRGEVREYGRIANTPAALRRLAGKLGQEGMQLRFCYEAGPCGYGIQRQLWVAVQYAFAQAELRTAENLSNMSEKLAQSAPPTSETGGALLKRCLMDRHYSHAVTTQADAVSRRHLQVAFPRDVSRDAGGNDTPTHEVIAYGLRP
jgi:hypothetical protein